MLTSGKPNFRFFPSIGGFDMAGPTICALGDKSNWCLAFLNSSAACQMLHMMNPTLNLQAKEVKALPFIFNEKRKPDVNLIVDQCIRLSVSDWNSRETSWDFRRCSLL